MAKKKKKIIHLINVRTGPHPICNKKLPLGTGLAFFQLFNTGNRKVKVLKKYLENDERLCNKCKYIYLHEKVTVITKVKG